MKRIIAYILSVCMLVNIQCFAADDNYSELHNYGILIGDEHGNLNYDENITHCQMIKMIVVASGYGEIAKDYKTNASSVGLDISDEHWAKGYIDFAVENKLIIIHDKANFVADEQLTDVDALRYLICGLGYDEFAQARGGNIDSAYVSCALKIGLLDDGDMVKKSPITRKEAAKLVTASLDIPLMKQTGFGGEITYSIMDGKAYPLETFRLKLNK